MPDVAVNLLLDCVVSITPGGADDGAITVGSPITVLCDEVEITPETQTEEHSTGQQAVSWERTRKDTFSIEIRTKLLGSHSALLAALDANRLFRVTVTTGAAVGFVADCILKGKPRTYGIPSMLRISFGPYGTALQTTG